MCKLTAPCLGPLRTVHNTGGHAVISCLNGHHFILGSLPPLLLDPPKKRGGQNKGKGTHHYKY